MTLTVHSSYYPVKNFSLLPVCLISQYFSVPPVGSSLLKKSGRSRQCDQISIDTPKDDVTKQLQCDQNCSKIPRVTVPATCPHGQAYVTSKSEEVFERQRKLEEIHRVSRNTVGIWVKIHQALLSLFSLLA